MGLEFSRKFLYHPTINRSMGNWSYGYKVEIGYNPQRQFLFFHGNRGCAQDRLPLVGLYGDGIYYIHEYMGYGSMAYQEPNKTSIINHSIDAVEHLDISKPIYLIGESLGSAVVSEIVSKREIHNLKGIILITPFCRLTEIANKFVPVIGGVLLKDKYNCIDNLKNYKGEVVIIGGKKDKITPYNHSERLQEATNGHLLTFNGDHNEVYKYSYQWLNPLKKILFDKIE